MVCLRGHQESAGEGEEEIVKTHKPDASSWVGYTNTIKEILEIESLTQKQASVLMEMYINSKTVAEAVNKLRKEEK